MKRALLFTAICALVLVLMLLPFGWDAFENNFWGFPTWLWYFVGVHLFYILALFFFSKTISDEANPDR